MTVDFAVIRPLVRPGRPRIRFLSIRSRFCSTLPSDPASRRRPCASLALRRHQAGQRTSTSKLPSMLGTRKYPPAKPGALRLGPLKGAHFPTFDDVPRIQARYLHRDGTLDRAVGIVAPTARNPTSAESIGAPPSVGLLNDSELRRAYRRKCQTSTATPAKPGDLPIY